MGFRVNQVSTENNKSKNLMNLLIFNRFDENS